jgi:hypothetical protein
MTPSVYPGYEAEEAAGHLEYRSGHWRTVRGHHHDYLTDSQNERYAVCYKCGRRLPYGPPIIVRASNPFR